MRKEKWNDVFFLPNFGCSRFLGSVAQQPDPLFPFLEAFVERVDLILANVGVRLVVRVRGVDAIDQPGDC
jgi:hypothetical protein